MKPSIADCSVMKEQAFQPLDSSDTWAAVPPPAALHDGNERRMYCTVRYRNSRIHISIHTHWRDSISSPMTIQCFNPFWRTVISLYKESLSGLIPCEKRREAHPYRAHVHSLASPSIFLERSHWTSTMVPFLQYLLWVLRDPNLNH